MPRIFLGNWNVAAHSKIFGPSYSAAFVLGSGNLSGQVGIVTYTMDTHGVARTLVCSSDLVLYKVGRDRITLRQTTNEMNGRACQPDREIAVLLASGRLYFAWTSIKAKNSKEILSGWAN